MYRCNGLGVDRFGTARYRLEPLDIGGYVIELDMTDFAQLDYDQLCAEIRQLWRNDTQS
jgi:hypothetical protein